MKRRVVRRVRRGKGIGDFFSGALSGLGSGIGRGANNLLSGLFGGRRRVVKKRRVARRGGRLMPALYAMNRNLPLVGLGRRRTVRRRRRGGAGEEAAPTSLLGKLNKVAKDSKIISRALGTFNLPFADSAALLGYGRRRRGGSHRVIVW